MLAEETDEENDIRPLRIKKEKMVKASQSEGFNKNDYLPSVELVEAHVKALCELFETQKTDDPVAMRGEEYPRTPGVKSLLGGYRLKRGEIAKSAHAETLTVSDGYELDFLREVMRVSWTHQYQTGKNSSTRRCRFLLNDFVT